LNNEADRLRNLHEVVSRIALERDNSNIFTLITGMFYNMDFLSIAIYQAFQEGGANNFRLTGKSGNWAGLLKKNALLDRLNQVALSRNLESNILETDNSYSLMVPIIIRNELFGILYTRKKEVFSQQDIDIVLIMINYLVIFWELNNLIATTEQEALVDSLTAVWNRRYIMRRIKEEDEKLIRHGGEACIAILDLGNLKPINDQFGHSTGDKILKAIAQAIANSIRTIDAVGRSGGDEFIVLFPNTTMDEAQAALNRINTAVSEQQIEALDIDIIADFGLASCPQDAKSLMEALDIADERMYAYKRKRKENKNRRE
ncbi:MAG: GGDEF domain-containing protein, partial [Syntrophomonas sp.]